MKWFIIIHLLSVVCQSVAHQRLITTHSVNLSFSRISPQLGLVMNNLESITSMMIYRYMSYASSTMMQHVVKWYNIITCTSVWFLGSFSQPTRLARPQWFQQNPSNPDVSEKQLSGMQLALLLVRHLSRWTQTADGDPTDYAWRYMAMLCLRYSHRLPWRTPRIL